MFLRYQFNFAMIVKDVTAVMLVSAVWDVKRPTIAPAFIRVIL